MSTASTGENSAARIQAALRLLREHRDGIGNVDGRSGIFARVRELVPFNEHESELLSGKMPRGDKNFSFNSSNLVNAGWITKVDGTWRITDDGVAALEEFPEAVELKRALRRLLDARRKAERVDRSEALNRILVPRSSAEELVRAAARQFAEHGLRDGQSVFSPGRTVWTKEEWTQLKHGFLDSPDSTNTGFEDKLPGQMANVTDSARLLMAEIIAWQVLPIDKSSIGQRKKEDRVAVALGTMEHPVQVPEDVSKAFAVGVASPGRAMVQDRFGAMCFLLNLLGQWLEITAEDQEQLLDDPWAWLEFSPAPPCPVFRTGNRENGAISVSSTVYVVAGAGRVNFRENLSTGSPIAVGD